MPAKFQCSLYPTYATFTMPSRFLPSICQWAWPSVFPIFRFNVQCNANWFVKSIYFEFPNGCLRSVGWPNLSSFASFASIVPHHHCNNSSSEAAAAALVGRKMQRPAAISGGGRYLEGEEEGKKWRGSIRWGEGGSEEEEEVVGKEEYCWRKQERRRRYRG